MDNFKALQNVSVDSNAVFKNIIDISSNAQEHLEGIFLTGVNVNNLKIKITSPPPTPSELDMLQVVTVIDCHRVLSSD